ncbi:MAG: LutB/LldF family L-lactate oxidation iron-sulfur protein [Acidobacteriota bacterium]
MKTMRARAQQALRDQQLQRNLRSTLGKTLTARDRAVSGVSNWEELRQYASDVKTHTLARLSHYLEELESRIIEQGGKVVWARTPQEAVHFILDLAHEKDVRKVVKSKTMVGEEIHLNQALERSRIEPIETDLGEFIVQQAGQTPSHIIAPALHLSKEEVARLFVDRVGMAPTRDVEQITATFRQVMRREFLRAPMGITGVNFAIAETGTLVVVENEGNARLTVSAPRIHVAVMGIEKVIPRLADLAVFLKLLTRSATGQKITSYVNLINGARRSGERDGPREFYLVLLDNGRSQILEDEFLRQTLSCIRCGACLNVCPVYQSVGGHAYASTYQGPIGAILTPQLEGLEEAPDPPYASSLCGACYDICPVKIKIPHILLQLRQRVQQRKNARAARVPLEKLGMSLWAWAMQSPENYARTTRWARRLQTLFGRRGGRLTIPFPPFNRWTEKRSLPRLAPRSFREIHCAKVTK